MKTASTLAPPLSFDFDSASITNFSRFAMCDSKRALAWSHLSPPNFLSAFSLSPSALFLASSSLTPFLFLGIRLRGFGLGF